MAKSGLEWKKLVIPITAMGVLLCSAASAGASGEPIEPLPDKLILDSRKVALGFQLFRDPRFAKDNSVACSSCHLLEHGGADPRPVSVGAGGITGVVNAPSILNAANNFRQLWNGGAETLEEVIGRVVANPHIFDSNWSTVTAKLGADGQLARGFDAAYRNGVTTANIKDALAQYLRSLATPSRFDRYLRGQADAITAEEKSGYDRFKKYGCVACHQGINLGGNMYQRFGAMADYFRDRAAAGRPVDEADLGRYNVTKQEADRHVFKVPSLRNVAQTAPYFHDASAATLEDAVDVMFKYQLGRGAPRADKALIVKFLHTLSAEPSPP